jgi:hypothetical protein
MAEDGFSHGYPRRFFSKASSKAINARAISPAEIRVMGTP